MLLIRSSRFAPIVLPAPRIGAQAAMVLPAAERAAEIPAMRITGMRQKPDPAVRAENRAVPQLRTIAQDGIQRALILSNKRKGAVVLVPLFAKRENLGDRYNKIARFSVKMSSGFCISSSYSLDAKASRRRARIFSCSRTKDGETTQLTDPHVNDQPTSFACPVDATSLDAPQNATWKEELDTPTAAISNAILVLPFQVVDRFSRASPAHSAERHRPPAC